VTPDREDDLIAVADVVIDVRTAGTESVYTYRAVAGVQVGQARLISLGPRRMLAYVVGLRSVKPDDLGFPVEKLRSLGPHAPSLDLPPSVLALVGETAESTLSPMAVAIAPAVPPGAQARLMIRWVARGESEPPGLTVTQSEVWRTLKQSPIVETKTRSIPRNLRPVLAALEKAGHAERDIEIVPIKSRSGLTGRYRLTTDSARVERFLHQFGRKRPAQAITLMALAGAENASFTQDEIKSLGNVTDQTVKALLKEELLVPESDESRPARPLPTPNDEQSAALSKISDAMTQRRAERFLLFGVTGSGKTEVFLRAASEALKSGRSVLYLVPEIALTAQVVAQLRERFGERVAVLHSGLSAGDRLAAWQRVQRGECPVVLGPRSALFAPITNCGLIVLDEEHEASYKQETAPRYDTRRLAKSLAEWHQCPVVLGSATPSVETFYAAQQGEITLLTLTARAIRAARLPEVEVVDLVQLYAEKHPDILSPALKDAMADTLAAQKQTILFLNRRAYGAFVMCRSCGFKWECKECAVTLSFHRTEKRLKCHHCGAIEPVPESCPSCGGTKIAPFGVGVEKVQEAVETHFPNAAIDRLDRDVVQRKGALEEVLARFRAEETSILVGTQMVAKGFDFPNVTLVGVIAADIALAIPDFRSGERTFQLLSQVAGRAGRGTHKGRVIIQTMNPSHPAIQCAREHAYLPFYESEIRARERYGYPPFVRLVNIVLSGENQSAVNRAAQAAGQRLRSALGSALILGPQSCPLERLQGQWRFHLIVKLPLDAQPKEVAVALGDDASDGVRIVIDVDPASLV